MFPFVSGIGVCSAMCVLLNTAPLTAPVKIQMFSRMF